MALLGVVVAVRQRHPDGRIFLIEGQVERRIGHQVEEAEFHDASSSTNRVNRSTKASAFSTCGQVAAGGKDREPRALDQPMILLAVAGRENLVVVAPDDQRRNVDPVDPLPHLRVVEARVPGELRGRKLVLEPDVDLLLGQRHRQPQVGELLIDEQVADALLRRPQEQVALRTPEMCRPAALTSVSVARRRGAADRDFGGDPAAERIADRGGRRRDRALSMKSR